MRVLVDTNVLFSRLLQSSHTNSSINRLFDAVIRERFLLVVPEDVLDELIEAREKKPYLANAISAEEMQRFIRFLRSVAEILPRQTDPAPSVLRDPRDDFLLIAAAIGDADYLITGDRDLLDIRDRLTRPRIVTVTEFLQVLSSIESEDD